jgi:hypothetical protein
MTRPTILLLLRVHSLQWECFFRAVAEQREGIYSRDSEPRIYWRGQEQFTRTEPDMYLHDSQIRETENYDREFRGAQNQECACQSQQQFTRKIHRPIDETNEWSWKEQTFTRESLRGPKPKTTVLARIISNLQLCYSQN